MNTIVVGVLRPGEEMPVVDRVFNDAPRLQEQAGLRPCLRVLKIRSGGYQTDLARGDQS